MTSMELYREFSYTVSIRRFMLPSGVESSCLIDRRRSDGNSSAKSDGVDGIARL